MALSVEANPAHYALAELSRQMPGFLTLSQNVDGLSQRAEHPPGQLKLLHGTLFELKCARHACDYRETNFTDPVVPALAIPTDGSDPTTDEARESEGNQLHGQKYGKDVDISDVNVPLATLKHADLPQCPKCKSSLLRPGVVWFGEALPNDVLDTVDSYINGSAKIDMILVIGTSVKVYPAAGYVDLARAKGARVCVVNMDTNDAPPGGWKNGDWLFQGDAAKIIPELLKPIIGDVRDQLGDAPTQ